MGTSSLENWEALPEGTFRQTDLSEIVTLELCSDRELLEGGGIGVLHRIALHRRYDALVQKRLEGEPSGQRGLSQRAWMTAFDEWNSAVEKQLPVPEWLGQILERTLEIDTDVRGGETYLPDPFAWYLRRALQALPPVSRLLLLLVESEQWSEEQISRFLSERGIALSTEQVRVLYGQAGQQLLAGLPAELNEIYFRGVLDCLSLVPWLYPSAEGEIRLFEQQRREALEATSSSLQTKPSQTRSPAAPRSGLALAGIFAAFALVGGFGVRTLYLSSTEARARSRPAPRQPEPRPTPAPPAPAAEIQAPSAPLLPAGRGPLYLLVRDPGPDGLKRLRRIESRVFYRPYQGQPYVQLGLYSSERQARATAAELIRMGFTVVFTR